MVTQGLVIVFALLSAICMAIGIVIRQRATVDVPVDKGVSLTMVKALLSKPIWWVGTAAAVAGFVFQAAALAHGSLIVVQPLLVSSLLFALPMSARLAHRRVTRSEWLWALVLTLALSMFVLMARPKPAEYRGREVAWAVAIVVITAIIAASVVLAARSVGRRRALLIGVAVGVLFGLLAVLTKLVMYELAETGPVGMLMMPPVYWTVFVGISATVLQQSAFHAGALQASVPTMLMLEPIVAVLLGALVLNEQLSVSGYETVALPIAVLAMAAATVALARDEGAYEEELESVVTRQLEPAEETPVVLNPAAVQNSTPLQKAAGTLRGKDARRA